MAAFGEKIPSFPKEYIKYLAEFAVYEYNKKQNAQVLKFVKLITWNREDMLEGFMFTITLEAFNSGINKNKECEVKVWVPQELLDFKIEGNA
ncbi:cysteine proteinase inhibitor A-like [Olea europaea var. sylvestris]|uniref:cysteine proteinase inhibitor A-like n=1 Tax=Olea europaea var. sylvestris TaxID=158386 RepID=UPI000C1D1C7B|nr:cysteine proteinase inhibitor A-like [Olea europaea var. sylvestris]